MRLIDSLIIISFLRTIISDVSELSDIIALFKKKKYNVTN